jgi:D-alanyl-D-alanine carboxypeptidase
MIPNDFKNFFGIENRTKYFVHVLFYLFIVSIAIFTFLIIGNKYSSKEKNLATKEEVNPFENLILEGKGIVVFDVVNNKEIFSKNPDMPLPLASLTKVMTAVTTEGKLDDSQKIKITKEDLAPEGDSKLVVGDTWLAKDLRDFTLLTSSNDGAFALAAVAESKENPMSNSSSTMDQFINEMNETAAKIGLLNSRFLNSNGLDIESDKGGAYGSAHDMAILFEYILKNYPEILEPTRYKNLQFKSSDEKYNAENTNIVVDKIPDIIASKTGYTDLAGGNLVIAFDAGLNRPIIISILGSTQEGRFSDALKLVDAAIKQITYN